jgi:hypothetical protein
MDNPLEALYWRDELLQIIYWFRGEGLGEAVTPADLLPFLNAEEQLVAEHLDCLAEDGYATRLDGAPARYQLTELGIREGGRRFADEFVGLTGQAHGECSDPNCSCKTLGPEACAAKMHAHT